MCRTEGRSPGPFEQAVCECDPEDGGEQAQYNGCEHRFHLVLGWRVGDTFELNHDLYRPGEAFQAQQKSRPCP